MPRSYYPPVSIRTALAIPKAIYEKNAGNPIFRITLAEELGLKSESQVFRDLITASAGYGLTIGSYASEKISLKELGSEIVKGDLESVYTALFSKEIFKKFYDNFGGGGSRGIPSEKPARDFVQSACSVPEGQSKAVVTNIIQDASDWLLIQNIAGGDKFVPVDLAKQKAVGLLDSSMENIFPSETNDSGEKSADIAKYEQASEKPKVKILPNLQLNIQIHISPDTSDEKIEVIFKNMRKYLIDNDK
jgi:hypothetical protein